MRINGNCLGNQSSQNHLFRKCFYHPHGSWLHKPNLFTIQTVINKYEDPWLHILVDNKEQKVPCNSICSAPLQLEMPNKPPLKTTNEYSVYLAEKDASLFKTVSVCQFDKPKYAAAPAVIFASEDAGFINNDLVIY